MPASLSDSVSGPTDHSDTDRGLAIAAAAGNLAAFDQLVNRHYDRVLGFLRGRTSHRADAEDIAQQAFIKAWHNIHRFDPSYRFTAWLYTIAARTAVSHHRRRRPEVLEEPDNLVEAPTPRRLPDDERQQLWEIAADGLPALQFEALWLHYHEELPVRETAAVMGKSVVYAKVLLFRGRSALGTLLRARDIGGVL